ncbi:uncharacterized protein LOC126076187 isoform X2 [Elephas maximus indicus]|uniref:uncharacterized protein LOC126076187 isoform X2 n=1 Tax=Elephas maximus indicus TaxID=99487 RepID=UPI0021168BE1|nr:uncharacterized protein LOC126076187 isoform X2 [Elephas maximus indicus]
MRTVGCRVTHGCSGMGHKPVQCHRRAQWDIESHMGLRYGVWTCSVSHAQSGTSSHAQVLRCRMWARSVSHVHSGMSSHTEVLRYGTQTSTVSQVCTMGHCHTQVLRYGTQTSSGHRCAQWDIEPHTGAQVWDADQLRSQTCTVGRPVTRGCSDTGRKPAQVTDVHSGTSSHTRVLRYGTQTSSGHRCTQWDMESHTGAQVWDADQLRSQTCTVGCPVTHGCSDTGHRPAQVTDVHIGTLSHTQVLRYGTQTSSGLRCAQWDTESHTGAQVWDADQLRSQMCTVGRPVTHGCSDTGHRPAQVTDVHSGTLSHTQVLRYGTQTSSGHRCAQWDIESHTGAQVWDTDQLRSQMCTVGRPVTHGCSDMGRRLAQVTDVHSGTLSHTQVLRYGTQTSSGHRRAWWDVKSHTGAQVRDTDQLRSQMCTVGH